MASPLFGRPVQQPQQRRGLLDRIQGALMPAPAGGLLSEEDVKNARMQGLLGLGAGLLSASGPAPQGTAPRLMQAVGQGIQGMQGAYQGAVGQNVEQRAAQQQLQAGQAELAEQQAAKQKQAALAATRQQIIAEHPLPADVGGMAKWVEAVLPKFMAAGDEEYVQRLAAIRSTLGNGQKEKEPGQWVEIPGPDGKPMTKYVTASEAGQGIPVYERPQRDTDEAMTINSRFLNEQRLEDHYGKQIDGVKTTIDAYMGAKQAAQMGGAGDLQVLYSFIRALDPASVVREGEVALARQAASLRSQAEILKQKFEKEGGTLSQVQRDQMLQLMKQMVELKAARARDARKSAQSRSERFGLNVYLYDPLEAYDASEGQQPNAFGVVSGGSTTAAGSNLDQYRQGKPK
jgi:hypothetical protein